MSISFKPGAATAARKDVLYRDTVHVWTFLLHEGGRWTVREIRKQLGPTFTADHARRIIDRLLRYNCIVKFSRVKAHPAYGVTALCMTPLGCQLDMDLHVSRFLPTHSCSLSSQAESVSITCQYNEAVLDGSRSSQNALKKFNDMKFPMARLRSSYSESS